MHNKYSYLQIFYHQVALLSVEVQLQLETDSGMETFMFTSKWLDMRYVIHWKENNWSFPAPSRLKTDDMVLVFSRTCGALQW